ncbi:hypothetical protein K2173_007337 [Erythroxylum novogranatense]|uniref:RBR-type E3 ubiquitin transferase n=1 Tax=Erythroxylum novogranatense TaxID=1862640 RepID=A0AAV8T7I3_9ROSI|nr:hypothetical protein K2173_007337 [Erythroxylum novogranatense]
MDVHGKQRVDGGDTFSDDMPSELDYYGDGGDSDPDPAEDYSILEELEGDAKHQEREKPYRVLREEEIRLCMEADVSEVSNVLSISKLEASMLLRHYNWNIGKVHDAWFTDELGVRQKVGLLEKPQVVSDDNNCNNLVTCGICLEHGPRDSIRSAICGHPFCCECWRLYIKTSIDDGPGCLMMKCPEPSCSVAVNGEMVNELSSEEHRKRYRQYLLKSYVEQNKKRKWCPAPNCENAIDFDVGNTSFDVTCACSHTFCWNCGLDTHRPVGCDIVAKWEEKNLDQSLNETWKKINTKPCPSCNRLIEKNAGCMHMMCASPCRFSFCWLCLKEWSTHCRGGCNSYCASPNSRETRSLKQDLLRYQHYYDRWAANERSRQIALRYLEEIQKTHIIKMRDILRQTETQLSFLVEAWKQIVECRQVLKWTYVYGYYLPENEPAKKQLFEYLQGEAELGLERLHGFAEKELAMFIQSVKPGDEFNEFRCKLLGLTKVTKNYFENLVRALENGLSDVTSDGSYSSASDSGSSSKKQKINAESTICK